MDSLFFLGFVEQGHVFDDKKVIAGIVGNIFVVLMCLDKCRRGDVDANICINSNAKYRCGPRDMHMKMCILMLFVLSRLYLSVIY